VAPPGLYSFHTTGTHTVLVAVDDASDKLDGASLCQTS
jgi:hypothetical protein